MLQKCTLAGEVLYSLFDHANRFYKLFVDIVRGG